MDAVDIAEKVLSIISPHWAFVVVAVILAMVGEVFKSIVIGKNKDEAEKVPWKSVFISTMTLHPVLAGALIGLVLGSVAPSAVATAGLIGSVLYFAFAGAMSTWLYRLIKELLPVVISSLKSLLAKSFKKVGASVPPEPPEEKDEEN